MERADAIATLAANLGAAMRERGWTQPMLAQKSGVGQTTISLYLNPQNRSRPKTHKGRSTGPTVANVEALAQALGMQAWQLLAPPDMLAVVRSVEQLIAAHSPQCSPEAAPAVPKPKRVRRPSEPSRKRTGTHG